MYLVLANLRVHSSPQIATRIMLPNEKFALEKRAYYNSIGLVVDATNGEFSHCPYPKGMGETGYYLLHGDHQHQGILQSKDIERLCFWVGDAKKWLLECDPIPDNYFELWDIYEEYTEKHLTLSREKGQKKGLKVIKENKLGFFFDPVLRAKGVETHRKNGTGGFDPEFQKKGTKVAQEVNKKSIELTRIETGEKFIFSSKIEAIKAFNLNESCLSSVCHGKRKTTGGFTARYL